MSAAHLFHNDHKSKAQGKACAQHPVALAAMAVRVTVRMLCLVVMVRAFMLLRRLSFDCGFRCLGSRAKPHVHALGDDNYKRCSHEQTCCKQRH
jgi:hypothetical protein